ncbi:hypothetical protein [Vibrio sp. WXL210]|uniref:hypothetical protein n=1 Tax=Vibrio sp. WXL210 TaxID=3450709 RepID=UPI003EC85557
MTTGEVGDLASEIERAFEQAQSALEHAKASGDDQVSLRLDVVEALLIHNTLIDKE